MLSTRQKRNEPNAYRPALDQRNSDLVEAEGAEVEVVKEVIVAVVAAAGAGEVTVVEEDVVAGAGDDFQH